MATPNQPPLDITLGTRLATFLRRRTPNAAPRHLHLARVGTGTVAAMLMIPGLYLTDCVGGLLFILSLLLKRATTVLRSLLQEKPDVTDIRIEHLISTFILMLMLLCIGIGQIKNVGPQAVGLSILAIFFLAALRVLLIYRAEQQKDAPVWQYTYRGYYTTHLLYLAPLLTFASLTYLIPFAAVTCIPLFFFWALYRVIRNN